MDRLSRYPLPKRKQQNRTSAFCKSFRKSILPTQSAFCIPKRDVGKNQHFDI